MNKRGFTLIEIVVTIAIMAILMSIGTFQFNQYQRKSAVERQTREFYADVVEMRSKALFEKTPRSLRLAAASYSLYASEDMTVAPLQTKILKNPVGWNPTSTDITFDTSGMTDDIKTICTADSNTSPVDSVVISTTSIRIGKLGEGATCADANVVAK